MSIFGFYFVGNLLSEGGWPRKQGMFKGEAYETFFVEAAIAQAVDWGAGLGACRPHLALQMLAEMYRDRDWESEDGPPKFGAYLDGFAERDAWSTGSSPKEAVEPVQLGNLGKSITPEQFRDARMRTRIEEDLLHALLWGLSNPDRFEAWYASYVARMESRLPEMLEAGLDVDGPPPPLPEYLTYCEQIIRDYERDIGPLPAIPPRLLADATALGWKVGAAS